MKRNGVPADHQVSNALARKMDKSSFHGRDTQRRFLHAIGRESHLGNSAQAFVRGQGTPFAQFRVLHVVEAGVGRDGLVHQLVCSTGHGGLQPGTAKSRSPARRGGRGMTNHEGIVPRAVQKETAPCYSHEAVIYVGDDEKRLSVGSGRLSGKADPSEAEASSR